MFTDDDLAMAEALRLAARMLGKTAPNPAVGCVLVHHGGFIAAGATGPGGRPHAEETALAQAGWLAEGATAYVTLEPCAQRSAGGTACTDLLIAAKVARVVVATPDPHPLAGGRGLDRLQSAGIAVTLGVGEGEALRLNRGFFTRVVTGRPLLVLAEHDPWADAPLEPLPGEDILAALDRHGAAGLTRVFVSPSSRHAQRAVDTGLAVALG